MKRVAAALIGLSIATSAPAVFGSTLTITGYAQADNATTPQELLSDSQATGPIAGTVANAGSDGGTPTSSSVSASANYGRLANYAEATSDPSTGSFTAAAGNVTAGWEDAFTIVPASPGQQFQPATVVYWIQLSGQLFADAGGASVSGTQAEYNLYANVGTCSSGCSNTVFGKLVNSGSSGGGQSVVGQYPAPATIQLASPIVLGLETPISVEIAAFVQATAGDGSGPSRAFSDFANTLLWGGILDVQDAQGASIAGWTISSQSGFDYAAGAVAEPAVAAQLAVGVAALAAAAARARRSQRPS